MHRLLLTAALVALMGGCTTVGSQALPVCDGKHLRQANPSGSVFDPAAPKAEAAPAAPAPGADPGCGA
jgi:hypothetical protein